MGRQIRASLETLRGFRGNARAILLTEPLWGIPFNLYMTYASVYMLSLGCSKPQIGLISTVAMFLQIFFSLVSGWITDRLGRRLTTLIFDLISWSVPALLWAFARGFPWFLAAAIVNSMMRIVQTSWGCLMVEDTPPEQRAHFYTWINIPGILAGFITPLAGLLVSRFSLVPAMRGLYLFTFASMTFMFFLRNSITHETAIGRVKIRESRGVTMGASMVEYRRIAGSLIRSPLHMAAFLISILIGISSVLRSTFLAILLTRGLGFPEASIAVFPAISAAALLAVYTLVMPALARKGIARPLMAGIAVSLVGALLLVASPPRSFLLVTASTVLSSVGAGIMLPLSDTLIANTVSDQDRAKAMSLFYVLFFLISSPFGYIGGLLAAVSDRLPFALSAAALAGCIALAAMVPSLARKHEQAAEAAVMARTGL